MKAQSKKNVTISMDASTKRRLAKATGALSEVASVIQWGISGEDSRKRRK